MTSKVNEKSGTLTPCRSETPQTFITKIGHIDYVAGGNTHAKFYGNRPRDVRPTNSQNITSCDFVYLPFPFLSFPFFLVVTYSKNGWTYLIDQYVKRRVFSQRCAFWGWENLSLIFNWFIWKKIEKITMVKRQLGNRCRQSPDNLHARWQYRDCANKLRSKCCDLEKQRECDIIYWQII